MSNSNIMDKMINHPIATVVILSTLTDGVARIIHACRGDKPAPTVSITTGKPKTE